MEIVERNETKAKGNLKLGSGVKTLFTKRKKMLVLCTMFVLLCVTGYLNFAMNKSNSTVNTSSSIVETNTFNMFRMTRADERTRDIMVYESLKSSSNASTVASAEAKLIEIRSNVAFETAAEGLIMKYGFEDVIVNKANGFVNVLIKAPQNITQTQATQIMTTLQSVRSDLDIDNVHISIMP